MRMFNRVGIIRSSMLTIAAGMALPAAAQTASGDKRNDQTTDIVVTAQKKAERLIDVPASITALNAESLLARGAMRFEDYQAYVPGLSTTQIAPGYSQINIRGVTTGVNQLSSTVGTYFDETPTNSSTSTALGNRLTPDPDLLDVSRIEVLRGPQGALYGANALGGVVKYVLAAPDLEDMHVRAQAGISSVSHGELGYVARAAVGAPLISGELGARISGFYTRDPGFIDNVANGRNDANRSTNLGGRLALRWQPDADISVNLSSMYQRRRTDGFPSVTTAAATLEPLAGRYQQASASDEYLRMNYQLHSMVVDADLGFANLVSATSFGRQKTSGSTDVSDLYGAFLGLPIVTSPFVNVMKKFTQEVRLSSPGHTKFEYVLGAFYTHENADFFNGASAFLSAGVPVPGGSLLDATIDSRYEEVALFGNGTIHLGEKFSVQAGGRWSHNKQHFEEMANGLLFGPLAGSVFTGSSSEDAWTFAVSPKFDINRDVNIYARVAKGFRPGGTNLVPPGTTVVPTYGSDSLLNYEAGLKAALADRRLNLSIAAFRIDWKDIQTTANAGGFNYLINGGKARSKGVEAEAHWNAAGLSLSANLSYIDAKTLDPITSVGAQAGDRLPYSPRWAGAVTADYQFPIGDGLTGSVGAGVRYTGSRQAYYSLATAGNPGNLKLDEFALLDLRAGLKKGPYSISLYAQNLTDKWAILAAQTESANPFTGLGAKATIARPRTFGLTIGVDY